MTYTPTTGNIVAAYERDIVRLGANTSEGAISEFNRWLQNMKSEVWARGYKAGIKDTVAATALRVQTTPNPYDEGDGQ